MSLILFLIIGALAGWIAGNLIKGGGFGLLGNMVVGVIGSVIGGWLVGIIGFIVNGLLGSLITAVAGAALLLFLVGMFKRS